MWKKNDTKKKKGWWSFTHTTKFLLSSFLRPGVVLLGFVSTRISIHSFIHRARWLLFQIGVVTLATRAIRARTEKGNNKIRTTMPPSKKKKTKKATTTTTTKRFSKRRKKAPSKIEDQTTTRKKKTRKKTRMNPTSTAKTTTTSS